MFKPRQDAIERDRRARIRENLPFQNLEFSKRRDSLADRPRLKDFLEKMYKMYLTETGHQAPAYVVKKWKVEYRHFYGVKDSTSSLHNLTSMPHLRRVPHMVNTKSRKQTQNPNAGGIDASKDVYLNMRDPVKFKEIYKQALERRKEGAENA